MFIFDVILYKLACLIWPDEPKQKTTTYYNNREDCANWIILDNLGHDNSKFDDYEKEENDPYLNGEYYEGPDW